MILSFHLKFYLDQVIFLLLIFLSIFSILLSWFQDSESDIDLYLIWQTVMEILYIQHGVYFLQLGWKDSHKTLPKFSQLSVLVFFVQFPHYSFSVYGN